MKITEIKLSENYAAALFDIAVSNKTEKIFFEYLKGVINLFNITPEIQDILCAPGALFSEKKRIINILADKLALPNEIQRFLIILLKNGRMRLFPQIIKLYEGFLNDALGIISVVITSAAALSEDSINLLTQWLERDTGKKIKLELKIDSSLLGGAIISFDSKIIDLSWNRVLKNIEKLAKKIKFR